jgi:hypothetical protein
LPPSAEIRPQNKMERLKREGIGLCLLIFPAYGIELFSFSGKLLYFDEIQSSILVFVCLLIRPIIILSGKLLYAVRLFFFFSLLPFCIIFGNNFFKGDITYTY